MSSLVNHWEAREKAIVKGDIPPRCPVRSPHAVAAAVVSPGSHHKRSSIGDDSSSNDGNNSRSDSAHVREAFWMKLLEEQALADDSESFVHTVDDEDRSEEDFLSRRNSLVGKEIAPADYLEGGSPVSMASVLDEAKLAEKAAAIIREAKMNGMTGDNVFEKVTNSRKHSDK